MLKRNKVQSPSQYLDEFFIKPKQETIRNALRQEVHSPQPNLHRLQRKTKQQPVKASSLTSKLVRKAKQESNQAFIGKQKNLKQHNHGCTLNGDYYNINKQTITANTLTNIKSASSINSLCIQQNDEDQRERNPHTNLPITNMFYDYLVKDKREQESISTELSKQDDNRMIDFKDINKQVKFATVITNQNKFNKKQIQARSPSILKNNHKNILNPSIIVSKSKQKQRSCSATSGRQKRQKQKTLNENNNTNKNIKAKYSAIISKLQSQHIGKNMKTNKFSAANYNTERQLNNQNIPKFKDQIFPPLYSSLFIKKPKQKKGEEIFWMRIPEIFTKQQLVIYKPLNVNTQIIKTDQSYSSDYIVTAFNCLAASPKLLQKIFQEQKVSPYGIYIIKIYQENAWKFIIIDDFIPVLKNKDGRIVPAFININSKADSPLEIWPFLLEKAYANYYSRYEALQYGNSLDFVEELSGGPSVEIKIKQQTKKSVVIIKQKGLSKLKKQIKNGQTLVLGELSQGKIYIPLVYSILNQTLYMSDPCKNYKRKAISFQNLIELCKTVFIINPFKYQSCKTSIIRKVRPKPFTQRSDGLYTIEHPSIRCFKVEYAGDYSITLKQRQNRLFYFKDDLRQYIWIRAILLQKEYGDNGFRWIDGQYNQKKSIIFTHFLQPGQYWILIEPEWRSSSPNEFYLQIYSEYESQITREIYNQKAKVIQSACLDLSQRYGQLNQINKFICSYNYVTEKVGLIIENIINQRVNGDVTVMRSIRGLKCKVQILPINKEFYQIVSKNGQQLYKINEQIELDIPKGEHFTVVLKLKGGMDYKFFKSFDFGC